ncbi:hypothetical protein GCHA_1198 [Paraglaciecola chathamensis S18K6]|uniref:Uncharacterized protein n=2 Tax=Paraglaciecola chathamensis TaxID=368405 RepID=A0ABQ0I5M8_9ALTE|nr:hypothetical protein GAGA_1787 [Paraglaciecola agarilytica NO2]GAC09159.1 hypothetical protein GCHA_1198 [Paraglaciecola chathamensis S18K6]
MAAFNTLVIVLLINAGFCWLFYVFGKTCNIYQLPQMRR